MRSYVSMMQISHPSLFLPGSPRIPPGPSKKMRSGTFLEIKNQSKFGYVLGAVLGRKNGQHGPNLAPKMEPKTAQNRAKIDAKIHRKNRCLSGPIFDAILMDFGRENGGKLAPKWHPKSILALKRKNQLNTSPLAPNWVRRVQVGSQNR